MTVRIKRLETDPRGLNNPRLRLVADALAEIGPRLEHLEPEVTNCTYYRDLGGSNLTNVWFGFSSKAKRELALANGLTDRIRNIATSEFVKTGYPAAAVASELAIDFTSEDEIKADGGEYALFR